MLSSRVQDLIPAAYRRLLRERGTRRFLTGIGASSLGDAMSIVTIAWLAVQIAPAGNLGLFVGLCVAAYTLPGVAGAVAPAALLRGRQPSTLVVANGLLRTICLSAIGALELLGHLAPHAYLVLLAGSSLLSAWGRGGAYTILSELGGADGRLAANSLASAQESFAIIVGPSLAGLLLTLISPGWLILFDAATFAFLGVQAWRTRTEGETAGEPVNRQAAESGFRLLRRPELLTLTVLTCVFFFLYGPVEDALPVYVAQDLQSHAALLGAYWAAFGVGALAATLVTGTLRGLNLRRTTLLIVVGWGACLVPFAFAPVAVTLVCFALGGLIYGPFIPLTYALFQSSTSTANLPAMLAARSAVVMISTPLGTALGGPIVGAIGASATLTASGVATVLLAAVASTLWTPEYKSPSSADFA